MPALTNYLSYVDASLSSSPNLLATRMNESQPRVSGKSVLRQGHGIFRISTFIGGHLASNVQTAGEAYGAQFSGCAPVKEWHDIAVAHAAAGGRDPPIIVKWSNWGPKRFCWTQTVGEPSISGTRLTYMENVKGVQANMFLYDFNPMTVRRHLAKFGSSRTVGSRTKQTVFTSSSPRDMWQDVFLENPESKAVCLKTKKDVTHELKQRMRPSNERVRRSVALEAVFESDRVIVYQVRGQTQGGATQNTDTLSSV